MQIAACKKGEAKNPFDVFGLFPDKNKTRKSAGTDLLNSSITNRILNGTTKRTLTLKGNFFVELRVCNTADVLGELREERWKKDILAVKVQIDDGRSHINGRYKNLVKTQKYFLKTPTLNFTVIVQSNSVFLWVLHNVLLILFT